MARYVVVYASRDGQTQTVAERLAGALRSAEHVADVLDHRAPGIAEELEQADAIVLAGAVQMGRIHKGLESLVGRCAVTLSERPSALVVVCLTATESGPEAERTMTGYVDAFLASTTWQPDVVEFVAGALRPARLGFLRRTLIAFVSRQKRLVVPREGVEFTDWEALGRFGLTISAWFPPVGVATRAPQATPRA